MQYYNKILLTAADMSQATITSDAMQLEQYLGYAMSVVMTGSPVGTLVLQGSCDAPQSPLGVGVAPTTFIDIGGTSASITTAINILYNIDWVYYNWVRLVYTRTSGTGSLTATFNTKG